jgi:formate dehydrogenase subunit gamma
MAMALADPEARRGMRTGSVERHWARTEHPLWGESDDGPDDDPARRQGLSG